MRKIINIVNIIIFTILIFSVKSYAVLLDKIDIQTDKTTIRPGENVTVNINFGEQLGAYTANIAYDNKLFEYVSASDGTANNTSEKVKIVYFDQTGGQSPKSSMNVTFKAKEGITTSNPTDFAVTLEGMANSDASITFDDITTPIIKNVVVEPEFLPYLLKLEYTGDIIANQEKDMKISYSSSSGRHYEKARLIAEATTPEGATVTLIGIDEKSLKHDIIQSGWGDAQGFKIGGKDFAQVLNVQGTFSKVGDYKITLKLIDRENSDNVIAEKSFNITVPEKAGSEQAPNQEPATTTPEAPNAKPEATTQPETKAPAKLPKTGINIYAPIAILIAVLTGAFVFNNRKK